MTERDIFIAALQQDDPAARRALLDEACGSDAALRARVEELLAVHERAASFLESPPAGPGVTAGLPAGEGPGTVVGSYKLLERIGEGGFGVVFMAEQAAPIRRTVAVKVVKPGMDSRQVLARFEAERQVLALMDHPNIARVLDAGATAEGRPYFVMELVRGVPITSYCDGRRLPPRERLSLFADVCRAVQHAHQKGVIHRDLKPSNVLVGESDGRPAVKVIDFGVAKAVGQPLTDKTLFTGVGAVVGTPEYMSPEQATLGNPDIDTRSDVYSLGVLLYELLTGTTPLTHQRVKEAALAEVLRVVREEEPPRPSTRLSTTDGLPSIAACRGLDPRALGGVVRGELDWIVMKALEKDRGRRYETANGFAMDIQRHLTGEPVLAVPPSRAYLLRKFARRNARALATALAVVAALVAGIVATTWQALRATEAEKKAVEERDAAGRALEAERVALEAERAARREAIRAGEQTLEALRAMTDAAVSRQIAGQAKLTDQDRAFLNRVIAQYEAVAAIKGGGPESRALRAEGNFRVGFMWYRLQEWPDALRAFERAQDLYRDLAADFPAAPAYCDGLARSHHLVGEALVGLGRKPEAEAALRQAIAQFQRLAADFPGSPEYHRGTSACRTNLAGLLRGQGRGAEAEAEFRLALAAAEQLAHDFPSESAYRHQLVICHVNLGLFLWGKQKKPGEGEAMVRRALDLQTKLAADFPNDNDYRSYLARCHRHLGELAVEGGNPAGGAAEYRAALAVETKLAAEFPAVPVYRQNLAKTHCLLGRLLADQGKAADAEAEYRRALALQQRLVDDFPGVPSYRDQLAVTCKHLGFALEKQGLLDQAVAAHRRAVEQRPHWPSAYQSLIDILLKTGRLDEAVAACREAIQAPIKDAERRGWLLNKIAWILATHPDPKVRNPIRAVELAREAVELTPNAHWNTLGVAHYRAGDYKAAAAALERSMAVRKGGDGFDWFFLAMARWQTGNKDEARGWYGKAVAWMDRNKPKDEELLRFRTEAAALLGIDEKVKEKPADGAIPPPREVR